jgi:hypothetical protein
MFAGAAMFAVAAGGSGGCGSSMMHDIISKAETARYEAERPHGEITVRLDGHSTPLGKPKRDYSGSPMLSIDKAVSKSPVLTYDIGDPSYFGELREVNCEFRTVDKDGNYSAEAEYAVRAIDNEKANQMQRGTGYPLGNPPQTLRVADRDGNTVGKVVLKSGTMYVLNLFITGEKRHETVRVHFKTQ